MGAIRACLRSLGLFEYADVFGRHIDVAVVCGLSETELRDLGLPTGTRTKIKIPVDPAHPGRRPSVRLVDRAAPDRGDGKFRLNAGPLVLLPMNAHRAPWASFLFLIGLLCIMSAEFAAAQNRRQPPKIGELWAGTESQSIP